MANFLPLKSYILYCLDRFIREYSLSSPFLDAGCGVGDVSRHMAKKGWHGKAIDFSEIAIKKAKENLATFATVSLEKKSILEENGSYRTVLLFDVIEHTEDDKAVFKKLSSLVDPGGHLVITVPSNPQEWRWDDELYGHYRRYTVADILSKLTDSGFEPIALRDFTYPIFWLMRRLYTRLKTPSKKAHADRQTLSKESSGFNAWEIPLVSKILSLDFFLWKLVYWVQYRYFSNKLDNGHEMIVLARRRDNSL